MNAVTIHVNDLTKRLSFDEALTTCSLYAVRVDGGRAVAGARSVLVISTQEGDELACASLADGAGVLSLDTQAVADAITDTPFGAAFLWHALLRSLDDGEEQNVAVGDVEVVAARYPTPSKTASQVAFVGRRGPKGEKGDTAALGYLRCEGTDKFHAVTLAHNVFGKPVLKVSAEEIPAEEVPVREAVSVRDYGAAGDGVHDDTDAFEAIAAARVVRIPAGTYLLRRRIVIDHTVTIEGDGMGVTTLKWAADSESCGLEVDSADGLHATSVQGISLVSDVKLYQDNAHTITSAIADSALTIDYSGTCSPTSGASLPRATMHAHVRDVRVASAADDGYHGDVGWKRGIEFVNCQGCVVDGCRVNGAIEQRTITRTVDGVEQNKTVDWEVWGACEYGVSVVGSYDAMPTQLYMSSSSVSCFKAGVYTHNFEGTYVAECEIVNCDVGIKVLNDGRPAEDGRSADGGGEPGVSIEQTHVAARDCCIDLKGAYLFSIQGCVLLSIDWYDNAAHGGTETDGEWTYSLPFCCVRLGKAAGDSANRRGCESGVITGNVMQFLYGKDYWDKEIKRPCVGIWVGDGCKYNVIDGNTAWDQKNFQGNLTRSATCVLIDASGSTPTGDNPSVPADNIVGRNALRDMKNGVVDRGVRTRLSADAANVRDYGARGNGETNDSDAFDAAAQGAPVIDNVVMPGDAMGPKICRVRVPAGIYRITRWIDVGGREVYWEFDPGAAVVVKTGSVWDAAAGEKLLNGTVMYAGSSITRRDPYAARAGSAALSVTTGGNLGNAPAPSTGGDTPEALSASGLRDQASVAASAYSRPLLSRIYGSGETNPQSGAVVVDYGSDSGNGTVSFPLDALAYGGISAADNAKRLRRGMVVVTRHSPKLFGVIGSWHESGGSLYLTMQGPWRIWKDTSGTGGTSAAADTIEDNWGLEIGGTDRAVAFLAGADANGVLFAGGTQDGDGGSRDETVRIAGNGDIEIGSGKTPAPGGRKIGVHTSGSSTPDVEMAFSGGDGTAGSGLLSINGATDVKELRLNGKYLVEPYWDSVNSKIALKIYALVTLNKNGGSGGESFVSAMPGSAMPSITPPTKTGYMFAGYWTTTGADGVKYYNADGTSAIDFNMHLGTTLYAKWTAA